MNEEEVNERGGDYLTRAFLRITAKAKTPEDTNREKAY